MDHNAIIGMFLLIQRLPANEGTARSPRKLIFILRDVEDHSIREVQEQTGLTESSIKSNLYVARKKLAAYLKQKGYQTS